MEESEDIEIDPGIAEAMGFSGFGMQPGKKRKFNANEGFIDPDAAKVATKEKGKQTVPSTCKGKAFTDAAASLAKPDERPEDPAKSAPEDQKASVQASSAPVTNTAVSSHIHDDDPKSLHLLREGVRNANGDMIQRTTTHERTKQRIAILDIDRVNSAYTTPTPAFTEMTFEEARQHLESVFSYKFKYPDLLREALHDADAGPTTIGNRAVNEGNMKLSKVGEAAISTFHSCAEYKMTSITSRDMRTRKYIFPAWYQTYAWASEHGIAKCITTERQTLDHEGMKNALQAIIGAMFLDSDYSMQVVKRAMAILKALPVDPEP